MNLHVNRIFQKAVKLISFGKMLVENLFNVLRVLYHEGPVHFSQFFHVFHILFSDGDL